MFPINPKGRPLPPKRPSLFPARYPTQRQGNTKGNVLNMFQDADGNLDFQRIQTTVKQINDIYNQVSPIFSKFKNRK